MPPRDSFPSPVASTAIVVVLTALWGLVRLFVFHDTMMPLTFVVPMLVCVWTRRPWQLWLMVAAFLAMAVWKYGFGDSAGTADGAAQHVFFATTVFNILAGGVVIQLI